MDPTPTQPPTKFWLVLADGVQRGPFPEHVLVDKITAGEVRPESLVSCGNGLWISASELAGTAGLAAATRPAATRSSVDMAVAMPVVTPILTPIPSGPVPVDVPMPNEPRPVPAAGTQADAVPLPPPTTSVLERDRIVVLGRRQSGKTVYLAGLYARLWRSAQGMSMSAKALSGGVHKQLMEIDAKLKRGEWPISTADNAQLEIEINYRGRKHLMVALDSSGEFFRQSLLLDEMHRPELKEYLNHIDHAAAALLLIDPAVSFNKQKDYQAEMEDDFGMVQAVQRIRNWPGGDKVPIVMVLTKMDQYYKELAAAGGPEQFVRKQFPALVRTLWPFEIVQVSAVQTVKTPAGKIIPVAESRAINLENPLKLCLRVIHAIHDQMEVEAMEAQQRRTEEEAVSRDARRESRQIKFMVVIVTTAVLIGAALVYYKIQHP